jgi:hypothetical protein
MDEPWMEQIAHEKIVRNGKINSNAYHCWKHRTFFSWMSKYEPVLTLK